jgi:ubiquinone/menaquinone biosynthesis C-methylase UbiE
MRYTLGTDRTAALRLETLASFFNPFSRQFIQKHITAPVTWALDLGCGPGFTTAMVAEAAACPNVCGLDSSARFLKAAASRFKQCRFLKHDVSRTPFPVRADLIYARFLLTHLKNQAALVNQWVRGLNANGMLLIEETDEIDTGIAVFKKYVQVTKGMIAAQGGCLYAGRLLKDARYEAEVVYNNPVRIPVPNSICASWYYPNTVSVWKRDAYIRERVSEKERRKIAEEIREIKESGDMRQTITWTLRRLVLRKI